MKVLIVGGTGNIGSRVAERLIARGQRPSVYVRNAKKAISDQAAYVGVSRWAGKGPYADALVDIWRVVREGRLGTVSDGVQQVLGRNALSFDRWAAENKSAFR